MPEDNVDPFEMLQQMFMAMQNPFQQLEERIAVAMRQVTGVETYRVRKDENSFKVTFQFRYEDGRKFETVVDFSPIKPQDFEGGIKIEIDGETHAVTLSPIHPIVDTKKAPFKALPQHPRRGGDRRNN